MRESSARKRHHRLRIKKPPWERIFSVPEEVVYVEKPQVLESLIGFFEAQP